MYFCIYFCCCTFLLFLVLSYLHLFLLLFIFNVCCCLFETSNDTRSQLTLSPPKQWSWQRHLTYCNCLNNCFNNRKNHEHGGYSQRTLNGLSTHSKWAGQARLSGSINGCYVYAATNAGCLWISIFMNEYVTT